MSLTHQVATRVDRSRRSGVSGIAAPVLVFVLAGCSSLPGLDYLTRKSDAAADAVRVWSPGKTATEPEAMTAAEMADRVKAERSGAAGGGQTSLWPNVPAPGSTGTSARQAGDGHRPARPLAPIETAGTPRVGTGEITAMSGETAPADISASAPVITAEVPSEQPVRFRFNLAPGAAATTEGDATVEKGAIEAGRLPLVAAGPPRFDLRPALGLQPRTTAGPETGRLAAPLRFDIPAAASAAAVIRFGHGMADLSSDGWRKVADLARRAREYDVLVRIVAHSSMRTRELDPAEHVMVNFLTSVNRANTVAAAFRAQGVPVERIVVAAVGDTQPLHSEAMPSGEAGNRRVEVFLEAS